MGAYIVALLGMSIAAVSGLTLIYTVKHFDPPARP